MSRLMDYLKQNKSVQIDKFLDYKALIADLGGKITFRCVEIEKTSYKKVTRAIRMVKWIIKRVQRKIRFTKMRIKRRVIRQSRIIKLFINQIYRKARFTKSKFKRAIHSVIHRAIQKAIKDSMHILVDKPARLAQNIRQCFSAGIQQIHIARRISRLEVKRSIRKMHRSKNYLVKRIEQSFELITLPMIQKLSLSTGKLNSIALSLSLSTFKNKINKEYFYITSIAFIFIVLTSKFLDFPSMQIYSTLRSKFVLHNIIEMPPALADEFEQEKLLEMKQKNSNKVSQAPLRNDSSEIQEINDNSVLHQEVGLDKFSQPPSNLNAVVVAQNATLPSSVVPIYVMVRSTEIATLSSETAATIQYILKEDDIFKKDDTLIEFDCRVQRAELKRAQAQLKLASSANKSAMKLNSFGSISESELIKAESEAEMASADVDKLTALVDKCVVKASFNGSVSEAMAHVGESLKPGDPLLKIVNSENLDLEMQVPSDWLRWLHVGTSFDFNVHELNKTLPAKVYKINPEINSVSQTIKIRGVLTQPEPLLLPGMSGVALFPENPLNKKAKNGDKVG